MTGVDAALIWLDSGVCSQNAAHSFWLAGRPLPLCARDLGLFGAFLLALPFVRGAGNLRWLCGIAPLAIDGANSLAFDSLGWALYAPSNPLRLVTGALAGVSLAILLAPVLRQRAGWQVLAMTAAVAIMAGANLALALLGTLGVLAFIACANLLARPALDRRLAWALALPELALLAAAKSGLLLLLR